MMGLFSIGEHEDKSKDACLILGPLGKSET